MIEYITGVSKEMFSTLAQIPYSTSQPEQAEKWVLENVENAFSIEPDENHFFETTFGEAEYKMYGDPIFRVFEMNLGFS